VSDPRPETFYAVDGPVTLDFASTDGMTETLEIKDRVEVSDPTKVRECERYVAVGLLSKSPPEAPSKDV
jgi:hypothetical protein